MGAEAIAALIAALSQSGINAFLAVQQANALNAKPDATSAEWAALDAALSLALDDSLAFEIATAQKRAQELAKVSK